MKQMVGVLFGAVMVLLILFGRQMVNRLLVQTPTTKGVVWPSTKTAQQAESVHPVVVTPSTLPVNIRVAVAKPVRIGTTTRPATTMPPAPSTYSVEAADPNGTDIFESLKIKKPQRAPVPTYDAALELDVPQTLKLVRAQPSVYKVIEYGDLEMRIPNNVKVDDDALMRAFAADGGVPSGADRSKDSKLTQYLWAKLIESPEKFLSFDGEQSAQKFEGRAMASGTGFLVSRDGIVLTNAHVIGDMGDQALSDDPIVLANLIGGACDTFMLETIKLFGGEPGPELAPQVATTLLRWFAANGRMTGTFTRAELVLQYKKKSLQAGEALSGDLDEILKRPAVPIVCPLEVLFKGDELPGKDVAILRAKDGDFDVVDRAICLPLGDSDDVLAGTRVQALGFPGIAFNEHMMQPQAAYRVSAQDGQVANTKPMTGGYDAIEMTADINHGDSGGPVVSLADGTVIGLNVGAASEHSTGHTLAIPINVAKAFLAEQKIDVDPGPATALWIEALKQYDAKNYADAAEILSRLARLQAKWIELDGTANKDLSAEMVPAWESSVNPYVLDLLKRAQSKAK